MLDARCYPTSMRTTINLDSETLEAVKALATKRQVSIGTILSELVTRGLTVDPEPENMRNGILLFPKKGRTLPVTMELVCELREQSE